MTTLSSEHTKPTPRVRVAAGILFRDERLLVGRRPAGGQHPLKWELPGGKIEAGEDAKSALVRELEEELGVAAVPGEIMLTISHDYPGGPSVEITFIGVAAIDRTPVNRVFAELRWVPIGSLETLDLLDGDRDFARSLSSGALAPGVTAWSKPRTARIVRRGPVDE